ncbi:MAG TPA: TIGR02281 family clan AA aspartic protease [Burkholderiales bacterium]|nr:TIGR02281 family clan AA aspartic protease [Burkholderiales bacterium]
MPTGFIARYCSALALFAAPLPVLALDVQLVGTFGSQAAVLSIDGGEPKTVRIGQKVGSVTVLSVDKDRATVEIEGKRRVLQPGQHYRSSGATDARQSAVLSADSRGHFYAEGAVNGGALRFVLDTGATSVALPAAEAVRIGLDYRKGNPSMVRTANGPATAWRVRLDTVRVGGIELQQVDAMVLEQGLDTPLLGMTFLNRVEMHRDGDTMTLKRRF